MATTSTSYDAPMTVVSLQELLTRRDESLRYERPARPVMARALARIRAVDLAPVRRVLLVSLLFTAGMVSRHALVLAGCAALVISAAIISPSLGWLAGAGALFFLEARRR